MFDAILQKVSDYNLLVSEAGEPYSSLFALTIGEKCNPEHIAILESKVGWHLPSDLKNFYNSIGNIKSDGLNENNSIDVFSTRHLLDKLESSENWDRIFSLGLLDMIKFSWGNDRYEIDELASEIKEIINGYYVCFGWFRTDDNLESANYLYFDRDGKFGSVPYHQDDFEDFLEDKINPLVKGSLASQTFEELIVESMNTIIDLKKEELED